MKIFISWSGKDSVSQKVAIEFSKWLPMIVQSAEPWISTDITSGDRWDDAIFTKLSESAIGIICVSSENINAPWLNFEAGAIAKGISNNKVVPLLINLKPSDLINSPLGHYQAKNLDKLNILELLKDINNCGDRSIKPEALEKLFEHCWDEFKATIDNIIRDAPEKKLEKKTTRTNDDVLEELLALTREIRNDLVHRVGILEKNLLINKNNNDEFIKLFNEYRAREDALSDLIYNNRKINYDSDFIVKVLKAISQMKKSNKDNISIVEKISSEFQMPKDTVYNLLSFTA